MPPLLKQDPAERAAGGGCLYVVATPIGNLEDITRRALKVLAEVDLIACEDTRRTSKLLEAHGIRKPMLSYFEHNERERAAQLIERMKGGARVALVSDSGTPLISDPGYHLVKGALESGLKVVSVPGACAVIAALSVAGLPVNRFSFEGFIPARPASRRAFLRELAAERRTMVFFEAANRLAATLADMASAFGGERQAAVVREMTKIHEEVVRGTVTNLEKHYRAERPRGEVTLAVEGAAVQKASIRSAGEALTVEMLREAGLTLGQASAIVARIEGVSRREVYRRGLSPAG